MTVILDFFPRVLPEVNPSRKKRKTARFEALTRSLSNYNQAILEEFMHDLRDDV